LWLDRLKSVPLYRPRYLFNATKSMQFIRRLITHLQKLYDSHRQDKKIVGVVYGARHMRNIIRFLLGRLNYRVAKAEWVTVFDL